MDEKSTCEIIDFINAIYREQIPGPVKFVVKRKAKKIEKLNLDDLPESFRTCTVEELFKILKEAHEKKLLNF
ncbi:hypothetical protein [Nitrosopumilus adriaticus]|uniref:Uncharacterized protein n=1 Tax=Nitrosopumilus adriaticus TaxID=1580092 RepID=A0A0D5C2Q0_9ARCH|nr:hypothetical protein [Nitrosopumilus adriaticus]AJW70813.1 hypothetical protein NADRNF5_1124 [Nitrosopumilus adriaticus]